MTQYEQDRAESNGIGWMLFAIAAISLAMILLGCDRGKTPPNSSGTLTGSPTLPPPTYYPPGSVVTHEYEHDAGHRIITEQAGGTGAGLTTSGDEVAAKFAASAPSANLPGIGSSGGTATSEFSVRSIEGAASNPLLWVGMASVIAAGVAFVLRLPRRVPLVCLTIGGGFIAAALMPKWGVFVLAAAGLGGLGVYIWAEKQGKNWFEALRAVTAGVEDLPDEPRLQVKKHVQSHAEEQDRITIRAVKQKDGLPSERPTT